MSVIEVIQCLFILCVSLQTISSSFSVFDRLCFMIAIFTEHLHLYLNVNFYDSIRGVFDMNCLLSSSSISMWGPKKNNTYLKRVI